MNETVLVVDAYSSGNLLAPEFNRRGCECVHVQSTKEIFPILKKSFVPGDFIANLAFDQDVDALLRNLKKLDVSAVVAGTETGVYLADTISEALSLKTNGTKFSKARRNKYLMLEALRNHGLPVARQLKSAHVSELIAFKNGHGFSQVVVKPVESAGAEDVRICVTDDDIIRAHSAIIGKTNMLGLVNRESIVQEYLIGSEYFINSVSLDGRHVICDMWRHNKQALNGSDFVYDKAELCDGKSNDEQEMIIYTKRALSALAIRFGPCHSEVMMTADGPRLIELGARLQGMSLPQVNEACIGFSPVDVTVDCYIDESKFHQKPHIFHIKRNAMRVNLIAENDGILRAFNVDQLTKLKSFFFVRAIVEANSKIAKTINYFTVPGFVMLVSEDKQQIVDDYHTIRASEKAGHILVYEQ